MRLTTIKAAAELLLVDEITVRRMVSRGELKGYRVGASSRLIRLDADEVDALLIPMKTV